MRHARPVALALLAVPWLAACAQSVAPSSAAVPALRLPTDTVWFISVRGRDNGGDARTVADSLSFGLALFTSGADAETGDPAVADPDLQLVDSLFLSRELFIASLRQRVDALSPPGDFTVFYVHGFGTGLHEGWRHAAVAHRRTRADAPWVIFSWPSNGAGIDWPSFDALVERAYLDDSLSAQASLPSFEQAARTVIEAVGGRRTMLVTHSLGVQLAGEALAAQPALRQLLASDPLRAIAYVAPDMEARRFGDYIVPATLPLTSRVLLYASGRDRVLVLSRELFGSERAGLVHGAALTRPGLETVETTLGERAIGRVRRFIDTNHSIARAAATLFDLVHVVGAQRDAACRATLGTATLDSSTVWRMTADPVPPLANLAHCAAPAPP